MKRLAAVLWHNALLFEHADYSAAHQQGGREAAGTVSFDREFRVEVEYELRKAVADLEIVLRIISETGTIVFTSSDVDGQEESAVARVPGRYLSGCKIPGKFLRTGSFFLTVGARQQGAWLERYENLLRFEVSPVGNPLQPGRIGVITPILDWEVSRLD